MQKQNVTQIMKQQDKGLTLPLCFQYVLMSKSKPTHICIY